MPKKTIAKSAKTGKIVTKKFATENPETTFEAEVDTVEGPVDVEPSANVAVEGNTVDWAPAIGEKFDLNGEIASIEGDGSVWIHEVLGGCKSERRLEGAISLDAAKPLDKDEAFRRLAN